MVTIAPAHKQDYPQLLTLWETSVKSTHAFLTEQTIQTLKPLILDEYFPAVTLFCSRDHQNNITGFAGIYENKLEMLFIGPDYQGQGIGKTLLQYVIKHFNIDTVDVNEQNPQATGFYLHHGFKIIGHSELDGQGNPFPLLHMKLNTKL